MSEYKEMSSAQLEAEFNALSEKYDEYRKLGLSLDMSRGKPGVDQMDVSHELFHQITDTSGYLNETGVDCRNYGGLDGLPELKRLFGQILEMPADQVIVAGNSSLNLMFDFITQAMTKGVLGSRPWIKNDKIKFLCPAPGYDRHFAITEYYGFELITVPCDGNGPDMDEVERLVSQDADIKGIWCVPKYSNPLGITYSDDVVRRLAKMQTAAEDFIIMWDNAYVLHTIYGDAAPLLNIYDECVKAGNPNRVVMFTSTSKITFPGAGLAAMAASPEMISGIKNRMSYQTIGPDKLNQLRHARMFKTLEDVKAHMRVHADIIRPKFKAVLDAFRKNLAGTGAAKWTEPQGGYFISLDVPQGCASRVAALCKGAGLTLTGAGATYPYGKDPQDSNLRIAPTYPSTEELKTAADLLCVAVKLAVLEQMTGKSITL